MIDLLELPNVTGEDLHAENHTRLWQSFGRVRPMPGAVRLVQHLVAHRIPVALATSSHRTTALVRYDMIRCVICRDLGEDGVWVGFTG